MVSLLLILSPLINTFNFLNYGSNDHAMYISVVEIEQEANDENGLIRVKVFANDLEDAIFNFLEQRIDLVGANCKTNAELINRYFDSYLAIKIDNQLLKYSLSSCEVNDISIWLTFTFKAKEDWETVEVKANYLMELFPTQSNIINITYGGDKRMFRLTKDSPHKSIDFSK